MFSPKRERDRDRDRDRERKIFDLIVHLFCFKLCFCFYSIICLAIPETLIIIRSVSLPMKHSMMSLAPTICEYMHIHNIFTECCNFFYYKIVVRRCGIFDSFRHSIQFNLSLFRITHEFYKIDKKCKKKVHNIDGYKIYTQINSSKKLKVKQTTTKVSR